MERREESYMIKKKKIMIVDDEQGICDLLNRLFSGKDYDVTTQTEVLKAVEQIKTNRPDCILLDIKMPKMDGIEFLSFVKSIDENIKVIMITGHGNLETAMEAMKLGAYDYITKPFDIEFISNLVLQALKK